MATCRNHHLLGQRAVLAGAQAGARLTLWALSPGGNGDELALEVLHSQVFEEASEGSLCLSLDWNNKLINRYMSLKRERHASRYLTDVYCCVHNNTAEIQV